MKDKLTIKEGRKIVEKIHAIKECGCHCHNPKNTAIHTGSHCCPKAYEIHCQPSEKEHIHKLNRNGVCQCVVDLAIETGLIEPQQTSRECVTEEMAKKHNDFVKEGNYFATSKQDRSWETEFQDRFGLKDMFIEQAGHPYIYDGTDYTKKLIAFIKSLLKEQEERIRIRLEEKVIEIYNDKSFTEGRNRGVLNGHRNACQAILDFIDEFK